VRLLILGAALAVTLWLIARGLARRAPGGTAGSKKGGATPLVQDPVCKTFIPRDTAIAVHGPDGEHYFCSERCAQCYRREHA
jgi:YHS domain-containing protein